MHVEEILDEEEYKRLLGDLTFDILGDSSSRTSLEVLDVEEEETEEEEDSMATAWKSINSAVLLGPANLLRKSVIPTPPPPFPSSPATPLRSGKRVVTLLTPLEAEFLDRASTMHSQTDKIRQSFDEARRRVETDDLILELHREVRQRHRQHLNTIHSSLPRNPNATKTALLREVVGRGRGVLQATEWNGFFIVRKPEV